MRSESGGQEPLIPRIRSSREGGIGSLGPQIRAQVRTGRGSQNWPFPEASPHAMVVLAPFDQFVGDFSESGNRPPRPLKQKTNSQMDYTKSRLEVRKSNELNT